MCGSSVRGRFVFFLLIHTDFRSNLNTIYSTTEFSVSSMKAASAETKDFPS